MLFGLVKLIDQHRRNACGLALQSECWRWDAASLHFVFVSIDQGLTYMSLMHKFVTPCMVTKVHLAYNYAPAKLCTRAISDITSVIVCQVHLINSIWRDTQQRVCSRTHVKDDTFTSPRDNLPLLVGPYMSAHKQIKTNHSCVILDPASQLMRAGFTPLAITSTAIAVYIVLDFGYSFGMGMVFRAQKVEEVS